MDLGVELVLPLEEAGGRSLPPRMRASGRERVRDGRGPGVRRIHHHPPAAARSARTRDTVCRDRGSFPFAWKGAVR